MADWEAEYKAKLRVFMEKHGDPMQIDRDASDWGRVNQYGWGDFEAMRHTRDRRGDGCRWVVPEGALLEERAYSMFEDTYTGNRNEVGIEVYPVHCACGQYADVTLRYVGSLGDVLRAILDIDKKELTL